MAGINHRSEDYLRTISEIVEGGAPANLTRIAQRLHRSLPTVIETLGRLSAKGHVQRVGHTFVLTAAGAHIAHSLVQRHRLTELLLVEAVGLTPQQAHEEADRWGHLISHQVEDRLSAFFVNPSRCCVTELAALNIEAGTESVA